MGLRPSCSVADTLAALDAAGIAIIQRDEGWFIEALQQTTGPYTTPEQALEVSVRWLNESHWEQTNVAYEEEILPLPQALLKTIQLRKVG